MADKRSLPELRNPMLVEERAPQHDILVERRCLGQTELKVKPGQVGVSNATKLNNLGVLDYAHLRVPLPKDLTTSGIFSRGPNNKYPESYFLMRRSSDGYVSATGMFKAAFPYAQHEEEAAEKEYIKTLSGTSSEEVAGNVWIHPDTALELAEEYGIKLWILALLDPAPIIHGTDSSKSIKSPPTYWMREMTNGVERSPEKAAKGGRHSTRGKRAATRSISPEAPTKTPSRPIKTPRKPRGRGRNATRDTASVEPESVNGDAAAVAAATTTTTMASTASTKLESVAETVTVEVETTRSPQGDDADEAIENTKVSIEMPSGHPDLPIPDDAQELIREARRMVVEAEKLTGPSAGKGKRKAEEMIDEDDEVGLDGPADSSKRTRKMEIELRKERIRKRAVAGIAASLAIGALIPSIMAAFGAA
ncbi:hypothetical protein M433DRAFT_155660 [Acidomyces richmondensis BFW]|nr:MAG: hypothetical protein FE78DRAFT_92470 [Acidomyces sp. 'richmondensis']KYG44385.1 hypothetical protein M433DRAFT_155660 [Acidomyces richmondensis BFW]